MSKLFWIILCRCTALSTDYTGEKRLFFCLLSHSSVVFAKQPEKDQTGGGPWVCLFPQGEEIPGICQKELCWAWQTNLFERATRTKGYSVKGKGKENSKEELESRGSEARVGSSTVALQMCWVSRPRGLSLEAAGAPGGQLNVQVISASPFCPSSWWPCPDGSEGVAWCPLLTVPAQWLFAHSQMPLLFISSQSLPLPPLPSFLCSQHLLFFFLPMLLSIAPVPLLPLFHIRLCLLVIFFFLHKESHHNLDALFLCWVLSFWKGSSSHEGLCCYSLFLDHKSCCPWRPLGTMRIWTMITKRALHAWKRWKN